jgi:hypothetical protein
MPGVFHAGPSATQEAPGLSKRGEKGVLEGVEKLVKSKHGRKEKKTRGHK